MFILTYKYLYTYKTHINTYKHIFYILFTLLNNFKHLYKMYEYL